MHEGDREFQQLLSYRLCLKHCWHHITVLVWVLTSFRPHRLATRNACHVMSMWCCCKCTIRVSWFLGPIKSKWHHTQDKKRLCQWDLHETWRLLNLQPRAETSFRISMRFEIFWVGFIPSNNAGECRMGWQQAGINTWYCRDTWCATTQRIQDQDVDLDHARWNIDTNNIER